MKVSVLILTFNEAQNLPRCLASLDWCDDIVIVDSGSTDTTIEIADVHGARTLSRPFDNFAAQRNYGIEYGDLRHDWVLHLDADEVLTEAFVTALFKLSPHDDIWAYNVPSKIILFGRWLKYAGMYPTYQVRLGRTDKLRFSQVGHGQREDLAQDKVAVFPEPYLHHNFSHGMKRWLEKHVRYAADEAKMISDPLIGASTLKSARGPVSRRRFAKSLSARIPVWLRPFARFIYIVFFRQGFRDGSAGLAYAFMLAVYEGMIALFVFEAKQASQTDHNNQQ